MQKQQKNSYHTQKGVKYTWILPEHDTDKINKLAAHFSLSYSVAQTLINRGFATIEQVQSFLFTSKEVDVPDGALLKDAQKAVDRINQAINKNEKMLVFGDYDVDGITSSALMMISLLPLNARINFFLPHRVKDGYGLSTKVVHRAAENGYKVIITVDNGITAFEPAQVAKELGIDLIITDHHKPHDKVPDAYALVNPNQDDCNYPFKDLAGVGVTFKVLTLLYDQIGKELPTKAHELMLLGTIADVVPLLGENRFWVRYGLSYVNKFRSNSLTVLAQNGKVPNKALCSLDIGFSITPQINALGRLDDPRQGVMFLIGSDFGQVNEVGKILLQLNETRKEIERDIFTQVVKQIEDKIIDIDKTKVIVAVGKGWPPGVIGLVASRIVSAYGRPTILLHATDKGIAKGSCRSISAFNMFNALTKCKDLLGTFGGHAQAAGLSLTLENVPLLQKKLNELVDEQLTDFDLEQKITLDAEILLPDLTHKFVDDLHNLEPFGHANDSPLFFLHDISLIDEPKLLKDLHVKCTIFSQGVVKPVIFFNRPELYQQFIDHADEQFSLAVRVTENHWNGKISIELLGVDVSFNEKV
jgi:single-stranded-DNA-specific exonuclease